MKTKTLLLAVALAAAGAVSAVAQPVYSVNAVGFVNVPVPSGFSLIANPLLGADNKVSTLFPNPPGGTKIFTFNGVGGFSANTFSARSLAWTDPNQTLVPGQGFFIQNPGAAFTNIFVGEVPQGTLTTTMVAGFQIVSSQVPQSGLVSTDLKLPIAGGDVIYTFDNITGYSAAVVSARTGAFTSQEPSVGVGSAFWVNKASAASWTRTFSVNN